LFCLEFEAPSVMAFEMGAKNIAGWIPQENSLPARTYPAPSNKY